MSDSDPFGLLEIEMPDLSDLIDPGPVHTCPGHVQTCPGHPAFAADCTVQLLANANAPTDPRKSK